MRYIPDNSIFLVLNLTPKEDFDYNDINEVKNTYYESFLNYYIQVIVILKKL